MRFGRRAVDTRAINQGVLRTAMAGLHQGELDAVSAAAAKLVSEEQGRRLALERALATSDQQYTRELSDAQRNQALLCYC